MRRHLDPTLWPRAAKHLAGCRQLPERPAPGWIRYLERFLPRAGGARGGAGRRGGQDQRPGGHGPSIWFHVVPDAKAVKNRLHLDIHASGERTDPIETHRKRVDAEASRLASLGATITGALSEEGLDHYAVGMKDPEGNEFDIN